MKKYQFKVEVSLVEGSFDNYSPTKVVYFDIKENLPANIDAQKYMRQRIADELSRSFNALIEPIDNKTDEVKNSEDPLTDNIPF